MSSSPCLEPIVGRPRFAGALALLAAFAMSGCSQKEAACERAVKAALKNPDSYETHDIVEEPSESFAFDTYVVHYAYGRNPRVRGQDSCVYDNNEQKAYVDVRYPEF